MTQRQLEREVASRTGESVRLIHRQGFSLLQPESLRPLVVDWDEVEQDRVVLFPARTARQRVG